MNKRLWITAIVTSPIIAIYGASPLYIFEAIALGGFVRLSIALMIHILLAWATHIYCLRRFPKQKTWLRFVVTYLAGSIVQFIAMNALKPLELLMPHPQKYFAYPIITSVAVNALLLIITNSIVSSYRKLAAEKVVQELTLQNSEAQKQVLMQQLQPHFLFNALSVLKSLIGENKEAAEDYAVKLSEFLRYSVQAHKSELVTLEEELKFTNDYLELQRLRFDQSFQCDMENTEAALTGKLPVFALQTVVENAFKHNYFTAKNPLLIHIAYNGGHLTVSNKKIAVRAVERSGTGLKNLNERYKLIMGKGIDVVETDAYFSVKLSLIAA